MHKEDIIQFFDRLAPQWDADMIRSDEKIAKIMDGAGIQPGTRILDVACGTGVLFPDYLADIPELMPPAGTDPAEAVDADEPAVCAVRIKGSGFRKLGHRDYLGSLLGLGLERDAIGDIAMQNDYEAVVFCSLRLSRFLCSSLEKISTDTVKCTPWRLDDSFTDGRHYRPISDTVASPRLDCVVAALTNLSRDGAQTAIRSGTVEVDFEPEDRTDRLLTPPATISIRGHGRYILRSFDGETKKGRLRLRADQLV